MSIVTQKSNFDPWVCGRGADAEGWLAPGELPFVFWPSGFPSGPVLNSELSFIVEIIRLQRR
jgi:hypothetical protein